MQSEVHKKEMRGPYLAHALRESAELMLGTSEQINRLLILQEKEKDCGNLLPEKVEVTSFQCHCNFHGC